MLNHCVVRNPCKPNCLWNSFCPVLESPHPHGQRAELPQVLCAPWLWEKRVKTQDMHRLRTPRGYHSLWSQNSSQAAIAFIQTWFSYIGSCFLLAYAPIWLIQRKKGKQMSTTQLQQAYSTITVQNKHDDDKIVCTLKQSPMLAINSRHTALNNGTSTAVPVPLCCLVLMTSTCLTPWLQCFREDQRSPAMFVMIWHTKFDKFAFWGTGSTLMMIFQLQPNPAPWVKASQGMKGLVREIWIPSFIKNAEGPPKKN